MPPRAGGNGAGMVTLHVQPRPTPAERARRRTSKSRSTIGWASFAEVIEDWAAPRQSWEFTLHEGHEFGRSNNVEARLLFVEGAQTSSLVFRLEQLDEATDTGERARSAVRGERRNRQARAADPQRPRRRALPHPARSRRPATPLVSRLWSRRASSSTPPASTAGSRAVPTSPSPFCSG